MSACARERGDSSDLQSSRADGQPFESGQGFPRSKAANPFPPSTPPSKSEFALSPAEPPLAPEPADPPPPLSPPAVAPPAALVVAPFPPSPALPAPPVPGLPFAGGAPVGPAARTHHRCCHSKLRHHRRLQPDDGDRRAWVVSDEPGSLEEITERIVGFSPNNRVDHAAILVAMRLLNGHEVIEPARVRRLTEGSGP